MDKSSVVSPECISIMGKAFGPHTICPHPNKLKNKAQHIRLNLIYCALIYSALIIKLNAEWLIMHYAL